MICVCLSLTGGPKDEQKEHVLFSALTKFMKKSALSSLSEIERLATVLCKMCSCVVLYGWLLFGNTKHSS